MLGERLYNHSKGNFQTCNNHGGKALIIHVRSTLPALTPLTGNNNNNSNYQKSMSTHQEVVPEEMRE